MNEWTIGLLSAVVSILLTLTVTTIFNYFVGLPKKMRTEKEQARKEKDQLMRDNERRDTRIAALEEQVNALPGYRQHSIEVQESLRASDNAIIEMCSQISASVIENRQEVIERLKQLEEREKNALRAKILDEYRLYTDESKNPQAAWSEMEAHSFFELVKDYEKLGGNDFIHSVVMPAMYELEIIPMSDRARLKELYNSRKI